MIEIGEKIGGGRGEAPQAPRGVRGLVKGIHLPSRVQSGEGAVENF